MLISTQPLLAFQGYFGKREAIPIFKNSYKIQIVELWETENHKASCLKVAWGSSRKAEMSITLVSRGIQGLKDREINLD